MNLASLPQKQQNTKGKYIVSFTYLFETYHHVSFFHWTLWSGNIWENFLVTKILYFRVFGLVLLIRLFCKILLFDFLYKIWNGTKKSEYSVLSSCKYCEEYETNNSFCIRKYLFSPNTFTFNFYSVVKISLFCMRSNSSLL